MTQILKDGSAAIDDLKTKLQESAIQLKAQEEVIAAYSATIKQKDDELRTKDDLYEALRKESQYP